ncbi:MAG: aldo/keto reductase [Planctomycetota bacterium]
MSDLVAGTWRLHDWGRSASEVAAWAGAALDIGIDTFDLADIYGGYTTERAFGAALRADPGLAKRARIVTKCNIRVPAEAAPANTAHVYDSSAAYVVASVERSLAELGVERVDLLLLHRQDPLCDPDEVADAFARLAERGLVAEFGLSNAAPSYVAMLRARVPVPLVTNQVEASLLRLDPFEDGTFDQALELRMPPMAWSPLAGGRLVRELAAAGAPERQARVLSELERVAAEVEAPPEAVALAFLMRHPSGVRPVVGTRDPVRLERQAEARDVALSREQWFDLWRASTGAPLP